MDGTVAAVVTRGSVKVVVTAAFADEAVVLLVFGVSAEVVRGDECTALVVCAVVMADVAVSLSAVVVNVTDTETSAVEVPALTGGTAATVATEVYGVVSPETAAAVPDCFVSVETAVVSAGIAVLQDVV